jgi:hypothetical protein
MNSMNLSLKMLLTKLQLDISHFHKCLYLIFITLSTYIRFKIKSKVGKLDLSQFLFFSTSKELKFFYNEFS